MRPRDRLVIEEMPDLAGRRLPAYVPHLPPLRPALIVAVGFRRVVVVPGFCLPRTDDMRIEGPVRDVDAVDTINEGAALEVVRRQPLRAEPAADLFADFALIDLERQHALRPDRSADLRVVDERWRAAEIAVLADACRIEHRDRLTALALDGAFHFEPAAVGVGDRTQRRHQVVLDQRAAVVNREWSGGAAERAHQQLPRGIP